MKVSRFAQLLPKASLLGSVLKLVVTWILCHSTERMQIPPACVASSIEPWARRCSYWRANLQHSHAHNVHKIRTHPLYWISVSCNWKHVNNSEL